MPGMSFRITYGAASKFKYIAQALAKINDEATLIVDSEGVRVWLMSPDKTSLAILKIPAISLDELDAEGETKLVIRTDELNKIVKRATRNDALTLEYQPGMDALRLVLRDRKQDIPRSFDLTIVDVEPSEYKEPTFESTTRFSMDASVFKIIVQDVKIVGDTVTFSSSEDSVVIRASGEEKQYEWRLVLGRPLADLEVTEPSEASYPRSTLEASAKPTGAAERTTIEYATDSPMKLEYTFPNAEKLFIYIAPVLEE